MTMRRLRIIKGGGKYLPQHNIVLSRKAQLWLIYSGENNIDYLNQMMQLREQYIYARDYESINRITTAEIEQIVRNGLTLATKQNIQKSN